MGNCTRRGRTLVSRQKLISHTVISNSGNRNGNRVEGLHGPWIEGASLATAAAADPD